ncbi:ornithine carbamoyltransferase [Amycolatopsis sp. YIM 10]|uniref:ornithine carbamoyltransferase n=1 Tax=Amycolatopsis sp. YIM 10 TaxID=2653857 RepID=UPI00128FE222|nr:ornithine carbamoyltransferase [Amycolatopsis sp. YIM 10]QFU89757.1 Ornithine carbamoyltransferase [Amycolatopsis sp. YIM 10]
MSRHVISLRDLTDGDLEWIVRRGVEIAAGPADAGASLRGRIVGIYFSRTSTRTRTSFTAGALRLGAQVITYGPGDLQLNTGETAEDTARVLGGMVDGLVIRTAGPPEEMRTFAAHCGAVVNAMSADEHPTQALADLTTLSARFGRVKGLRVLYVGEGNNSAAALALALPRFGGVELELRTPPGYGLAPEVLADATALAEVSGSRVRERHDLASLPGKVDVVYTTRWQTTGSTKADPDWRRRFEPFQVDEAVMARYPGACFMHDLPAHRGEEVTAAVLDGPASIAFEQAQHKLYSAMAVLEWCLAR